MGSWGSTCLRSIWEAAATIGNQGPEKRRDIQNVIRICISPVLFEHLVSSRAEDRLAKDSGLH